MEAVATSNKDATSSYLLLVVWPGATSSFLLVAMPFVPSSVLAPSHFLAPRLWTLFLVTAAVEHVPRLRFLTDKLSH